MLTALEWLKANWKGLGYPLAAVFALLWWNKTTPCPEPITPSVTATQSQAVTQTAKAKQVVRLVPQYIYVPGEAPKPLPCPSIEIENEASVESTHWQSQSVTVTPKFEPRTAQDGGIVLGGGYFGAPYGLVGLEHKGIKAFGQIGQDIYGGGVAYTVKLW